MIQQALPGAGYLPDYLEVVWPPAEWTSVVLWSLLQLEAGSGHADKIVSAVRDD